MSGAPNAPTSPPSRASGLLGLVRALVSYGTFLAATLRERGLGAYPLIQGRTFGTTDVTLILARIARGLLRAAALEAKLQRCAARLDAPPPPRAPRTPSAAADPASAPPASRRRARSSDADDAALLAQMPTPEAIAADVRRKPIGQVIADICRDLGIGPSHPLWRDLMPAILVEGGNYCALVMGQFDQRGRMPIPEDWPDETPPAVWAGWSQGPARVATGPP